MRRNNRGVPRETAFIALSCLCLPFRRKRRETDAHENITGWVTTLPAVARARARAFETIACLLGSTQRFTLASAWVTSPTRCIVDSNQSLSRPKEIIIVLFDGAPILLQIFACSEVRRGAGHKYYGGHARRIPSTTDQWILRGHLGRVRTAWDHAMKTTRMFPAVMDRE